MHGLCSPDTQYLIKVCIHSLQNVLLIIIIIIIILFFLFFYTPGSKETRG